jgi:hypothetical protein
MTRVRSFTPVAALCLVFSAFTAQAADPIDAATGAQQLLTRLEGSWRMVGDVRGKQVQYKLESTRVLAGKFVELHMVDVQVPPRYEARVFIGADKTGKIFAHWLDSFGPEYSVPHGEGSVTSNQIEVRIPYPGGAFRDTFVFLPSSQEWTLTIDAEKAAGEWQHFAAYRLSRP